MAATGEKEPTTLADIKARGQRQRITGDVLGSSIDALDWHGTLDRLRSWTLHRESRYVCICNVHSVVTASRDKAFSRILNEADLATPDGAPIAWMLRRLGHRDQPRINGPDLMWNYCAVAQAEHKAIFLYGGSPDTLRELESALRREFPQLQIAGAISPPYRPLTSSEDAAIVRQINASAASVVFVGLGCPKQEIWMADHRGKISAVMIGVGAAFEFHSGQRPRAPSWMRNNGLEWMHRLASEPRRLWRRYLVTNTLFIWKASWQLFMRRKP